MTPAGESTCWTLIRGAANGDGGDRDAFARQYSPVVRAYLGARWRRSPLAAEIDDSIQDVFIACFQAGGALDRAHASQGGFRPFFYGVVRNIALQHETRNARRREESAHSDFDIAARDADLSKVFDRQWAAEIMRQTARRQGERAAESGPAAVRRVDLLRLRFHEGLPIRTIADRWAVDRDWLHHEYAIARQEFRAALLEVVAFHNPGSAADIEREATELLEHLQS
jgi:RNA polymerase sigma-70 factor (ECF subfamily)